MGARFLAIVCACSGLTLLVCSSASAASEEVLLSSFGSFSHVTGVAVDEATQNVYAANGSGPEEVDVFGAEGEAPAGGAPSVLTGAGTPAGSFEFRGEPVGVAVDDSGGPSAGALYVTDVAGGGEHEVLDKFTLNASSAFEYVSRLTGFEEPVGATVDAEGNVYVSDFGHGLVHEFSAAGAELAQFSSPLIANPEGLAVDGAGDLYVQGYGVHNLVELRRSSPSSTTVLGETEIAADSVTAVAVDRAANLVLVDLGSSIAEYNTEGHLISQFGAGDLGESLGLAVNEATKKIYVSDADKGRVDIFAVPALLAPEVSEQRSVNVAASSAELSAQINPNFRDTRYFFQFGVDASYTGGEVPAPNGGDAGSGGTASTEHAVLSGLVPGTTYHYRVKAINSAGTTFGPDATFTTFANAPFALPDNRVWEMVSPLDKNGGDVAGIRGDNGGGVVQATPDGSAITYVSLASFGSPQGAPSGSQYVSTRGPEAWSTQNITAPLLSDTYFDAAAGTPYKAFSADLSRGLLPNAESRGRAENPPPPGSNAPSGYRNFYLRETNGHDEALLTSTPEESPEAFDMVFKGATPDLSHIVVASSAALTKGASSNANGEGNLYEWSAGHFQAVNVLPGVAEGETAPGLVEIGSGQNEGNTVSSDGSRVFWSYEGPPDEGSLELFVRENGTRSVRVDAVKGGAELNPGERHDSQFWTATPDGARAFFTSDAPLTGDSNTGAPCGFGCVRTGSDLYRSEPATGALIDITPDRVDVNGADVLGVLGTGSDGSYVYFVATAALVGANSEGHAPAAGAANLYVWHEGEGTAFIATLSSDDQSGSDELLSANDWDPSFARRSTRVSTDGRTAVFMSDASLTGYDNRDASSSVRDEEVYVYDAGAGRLTCASCNPSGERPLGPSAIPGGTIFTNEGRGGEALRQPRALSADGGRVFFDSADGLVPQDTNGKQDVYEYESGAAHLISGGTDSEDSLFVDASDDGEDVFFITRQQLVSQDTDRLVDLYDARVNGGFPAGVTTGGGCQGEGCRPVASSAPGFGFPTSSLLGGDGNLPAVAAPVAKSHAKSKAKPKRSKKHKKSKAKHGKQQKRKAKQAGKRPRQAGEKRAPQARRAHRAALRQAGGKGQ